MRSVAWLEIDGLPNAARGRVPTPLFAYRLLGIVHRIFDPEHDHPLALPVALFERLGDVKFERVIAAFVMSQMNAVTPAIGKKIGGADVQNDAIRGPGFVFRNGDRSP